MATGGVSGFLNYEFTQAAAFAANDADLARSGWSWPNLFLRFLAHPWGSKMLSTPVLGIAAIGFVAAVVRRQVELAPTVVSGLFYLGFAIATMDPSDGVRYALPGTMVVALLAARGLGAALPRAGAWRMSVVALAVAAFGAGSLRYVAPVVLQRHASPSPPAQAAAYARDHLPPQSIILYDRSLRPHAQLLFSSFQSVPLGQDFGALADRADAPVFLVADGASTADGAVSFAWNDSDAYGKLTRNHYRVVSLIPIPQARRFRALKGVYLPERTVTGASWRWLAPSAEIALPDVGARAASVRLGLPDDYPWASVGVAVRVNGGMAVEVPVAPGAPTSVQLALPGGPTTVGFDTDRSFVPADVPAMRQRDARQLGVMLLDVEQGP